MRRKILIALFLVVAIVGKAQIPDGYYNGVEDKCGAELKQALHNIIKGHRQYPYTSSNSTDVWDILKESDRDPANPANVILLYTGMSVDAEQEYNNGKGWTREHVWAKVHGNFGTEPGAGTDAHHLRPVNNDVNTMRNSRWFAECSTPVYLDGKPTGCYKSTSQWLWKPRNEVIGDVARMIFYMATRYEGENGEPDLEIVDYIPANDNTNAPVFAKLSDLLAWHLADPVDSFEINRNNVIFKYQKNRNPFIDHPEYVNMIWGEGSGMPMFTSAPEYSATEGHPYIYDVSASVLDSSVLTFTLEQSPGWLTLTDYADGTALLSGVPNADDVGDYVVKLKVTSSNGQSVEQSFYVSVGNASSVVERQSQMQVIVSGNELMIMNNDKCNIQIYNIIGAMLKSCVYNSPLDVSDLKPGIYLLVVDEKNKFRFVVER